MPAEKVTLSSSRAWFPLGQSKPLLTQVSLRALLQSLTCRCFRVYKCSLVDEVPKSDLYLKHIFPITDSCQCLVKIILAKSLQMDTFVQQQKRKERAHILFFIGTRLFIWKWLASSLKASPCTPQLPGSKSDRLHYDFYFDFLQICSIPSGSIKPQLGLNSLSSRFCLGSTNQIISQPWDH